METIITRNEMNSYILILTLITPWQGGASIDHIIDDLLLTDCERIGKAFTDATAATTGRTYQCIPRYNNEKE